MKKILIIEDEVQLNNALKQALESAGFKVEQAYNGKKQQKLQTAMATTLYFLIY